MAFYIGIDGGGSGLRVALVDQAMQGLAQAERETVNPSTVGHEIAAARIQSALREVLVAGNIAAHDIAAVAIGVAGASAPREAAWLRAVVAEVLPDTTIVPSSDHEIALVGAHGRREGVLLLAGTGSVAYGIDALGNAVQAGGWGYLLGDEGSGYWLGMEGLRALVHAADAGADAGADTGADGTGLLSARLCQQLGLTSAQDIIPWLYRTPPPVREVAALSALILSAAEAGDVSAEAIIERGALALAALAQGLIARLRLEPARIAFAGGLLTSDNALSRRVCAHLGLHSLPRPLYPPVIGAALLAKQTLERTQT